MSWLLNTLHADLTSSKNNTSIIYEYFQGEVEVVIEIHGAEHDNVVSETTRMPFLMLGLDLPPPPLTGENIIPQVQLYNILKKYDGESITKVERPSIARMRYRVTRLPQYLILHVRRFTKNNLVTQKNATL
ncbi:hypothetical protein MKW94_028263, partial [Papaver nudicaule]|nr:hypothetical protein [Papaver nudicaule]